LQFADSAVLHERQAFVHFLSGLLQINPDDRWSPDHALRHPFITGT
jgi:dual specificity protein kinase YAK1